jgi:CxxC motif-containing protein (DUF1111 family)
VIEVLLDRRLVEQAPSRRVGNRCEVEREVQLALGVRVELRVPQYLGGQVVERLLGALTVGHMLEKAQAAEELVGAGLLEAAHARPHQLGGLVEPDVRDAACVQGPRDRPGWEE